MTQNNINPNYTQKDLAKVFLNQKSSDSNYKITQIIAHQLVIALSITLRPI